MPSTSISGKAIWSPLEPMSESEPVFAEPWQAHAFALAVKLSETGHLIGYCVLDNRFDLSVNC